MTKLAVPSYIWAGDNSEWSQCISAKPNICVINAFNGPGSVLDPAVQANLNKMKRQGTRCLFYVDTNYGDVLNKEMMADVGASFRIYLQWCKGIFWDRIKTFVNDDRNYDYHLALQMIAQYGGKMYDPDFYGLSCFNPGVPVQGLSRMKENTIWISHEDTAAHYLAAPPAPTQYRAREWHIVHSASLAEAKACAKLFTQNGIGYGYITQDSGDNPYDTFDEVACKLIK